MQIKQIVILSILLLCRPSAIQCYNICNFTMSVAQDLYNNGFHRNLSYDIYFENHSVGRDEIYYFYDGCVLSVMQILPAGLFVNPDELSDLRRAEKLNAFPNNGVNIEVSTEYARPTNAYIFTQVSYNRVSTWLPVHARYHKAVEGGGFAYNNISGPSAFLRCPDHRLEECDLPLKTKTYLCAKDPDRCLWKEVVPKMVTKVLKWPVPVGNLNHYYATATITLLFIIGGSMALIKAIHENKVAYRQKKTLN